MKTPILALFAFLTVVEGAAHAQVTQYRPLSEYLMPRDAEMALARTGGPSFMSERATIKVLTKSGYEVAHKGDNGAVCMVMRGFTAPTYTPAQFRNLVYDPKVHAPICFTAPAVHAAMPYYELRTKLAMEGKNPDQIAEGLQAAYVKGELPERDSVTFAYMWSAHQHLGSGIGTWRPHVMVFAPYYDNAMLGGAEFGSPFPQLTDDAGTPFAVVVIPVDPQLFVKTGQR